MQTILVGRVEEAATLLSRPYALFGRVVHGDKTGRQLGFPAANLELDGRQHEPADGAYTDCPACGGSEPGRAARDLEFSRLRRRARKRS